MSNDTLSSDVSAAGDLLADDSSSLSIPLPDFIAEFGDGLLDSLNRANPPVYTGHMRAHRQAVLAGLKRQLFPAQADVAHAAVLRRVGCNPSAAQEV